MRTELYYDVPIEKADEDMGAMLAAAALPFFNLTDYERVTTVDPLGQGEYEPWRRYYFEPCFNILEEPSLGTVIMRAMQLGINLTNAEADWDAIDKIKRGSLRAEEERWAAKDEGLVSIESGVDHSSIMELGRTVMGNKNDVISELRAREASSHIARENIVIENLKRKGLVGTGGSVVDGDRNHGLLDV
jgi:hypothetical protein